MKRSTPRPSRSCACSAKSGVAILHRAAERADRAGDEHVRTGHLARVARDLHRGLVDRRDVVFEVVLGELAAVRAEGVRLDDVRSRADEPEVERKDALRRSDVRLLGQRSRATALETSVPIPPSPTSGGPSASRSRKRPDMARPVYAGSEVTLSTHFGGAVKRLRVTPAAGELRRLRSLTTGSDAAAARVRSLRGEGAVPPSEELAGDGEAGAWRLPRPVPCPCTDRDSRARIPIARNPEDAREEGRPALARALTFNLSSGGAAVPIATATPGWGLTAISSGLEPPRRGGGRRRPFSCARSELASASF